MLDIPLFLSVLAKISVAGLCGGIIGYERERHRAPAGFKTQILICIGSTLFTIAAILIAGNNTAEVARVVSQIITGIGFIGAGAIIHNQLNPKVIGLTTAAWIWVSAANGILIGLGYGLLTFLITLAVILIFWLAGIIENRYLKQD